MSRNTSGNSIQCQAAVAWEAKKPLSIETINVEPPRKGEVRIKLLYTSVCHTDQYTLSGVDAEAMWPCILGHEGAGIVESVGEGVTSVAPGDHVVPLYTPQCRECEFCKHPKTNLCQKIRATQGQGLMSDGTTRFSCVKSDGTRVQVFHYMGTSTFSEYTVVHEISIAKIEPTVALDRVCLLGCGLSTGYGAAVNASNIQAGESVAIFGLGAVGLAAIAGAKSRAASRIIAIDLNEDKFVFARKLGATDCISARDYGDKPVQQYLVELTDGGLDHTIECVGNVKTMRAALEACHKGWGQSVIVGVAPAGHEISTRPFQLVTGRVWKGSAFGGWKSRDDLPKLVELYKCGQLDIDMFITHRKDKLNSLNSAFELLATGTSLRCVITI